MSEEEIKEVFENVFLANRFSGVYTSIDIIIEAMKCLLKLYEDKKEEIYAIGKTNYMLGQSDERNEWYKKIYKKIEELDKEEKEAQKSISDEEREEYSDSSISYLLMNIETRREAIKELIGKEE